MDSARQLRVFGRRWWLAALIAVVFVGVAGMSSVAAAAISQGYRSSETLVAGTLVAEAGGSGAQVVAADDKTATNLVGVVVSQGSATLELGGNNLVNVATSGAAKVYVTDLGGPIKAGDTIVASPIKGVGMKATKGARMVGTAQSDAPTDGGTTVQVARSDGNPVNARVVTVMITVQPGQYASPNEADKTIVPSFLQVFADNVAGKPVAVVRVVASLVIVLIGLMVAGTIVSSSIKTTLVSLGRNPLARSSISGGLWQISITAIVIMVASVLGAYAVLTR